MAEVVTGSKSSPFVWNRIGCLEHSNHLLLKSLISTSMSLYFAICAKASNFQSPHSFWVCCLSLCTFLFRVAATHRVHYGCNLPIPEICLLLWWPPTVLLFFSDSMYHWLNLSTSMSIYLNGTTKSCTEHILPKISSVKSLYLFSFISGQRFSKERKPTWHNYTLWCTVQTSFTNCLVFIFNLQFHEYISKCIISGEAKILV